jgi:hypothetical protein
MTGADLREVFEIFLQRHKNIKIERKEQVAIFAAIIYFCECYRYQYLVPITLTRLVHSVA